MKHSVNLFGLLFFFCMNCFVAKAQQKHFIYVQSEDRQPFAIVLNGKVYSSSDYGYIIIPRLSDTDYNLRVSFPMNKFPDQSFTCSINKKDEGFFLKNGTAGWTLQNMQTQSLVTNSTAAAVSQKNAFGDMLSDVVSDSSLTKNNTEPVNGADAKSGVAGAAAATAGAAAISNPESLIDPTAQLQKISETKLDTGTNMLFVDKTQSGTDTINVFIPSENANTAVATPDQTSAQNNEISNSNADSSATKSLQNNTTVSGNESSPTLKNGTANNEVAAAAIAGQTTQDVTNPFYKPEQNTKVENSGAVQSNQTTTINSGNAVKEDCANMISDEDLNKLKRKMFSHHNDDEMIQYAVKYLNKKCLTTDQVKSIGSLFTSDDGRYNIYDALYKYVYDYGNYSTLDNQILDPYYKKRFAALLR